MTAAAHAAVETAAPTMAIPVRKSIMSSVDYTKLNARGGLWNYGIVESDISQCGIDHITIKPSNYLPLGISTIPHFHNLTKFAKKF